MGRALFDQLCDLASIGAARSEKVPMPDESNPRCQYAHDVGMPEHRCAVRCQYELSERRSLKALQWARDTFGLIACDQDERAMRFAEEAAELVHAANLPKDTLLAIVERVYGGRYGEVFKEVGQAMLTLELLAEALGVVADQAASSEFARVQRIPKEEWERRHAAKVAIGIAK